MDHIIIEAYHKAKLKDFFTITTNLERLIKRNFSRKDPRSLITTGQVQRTLKRHGLEFSYGLTTIQPSL